MAGTNTPSWGEQLISNYFVEVYPGRKLGEKIGRAKVEFIDLLWAQIIDNPAFARFFRDEPHFTMMCARTWNLSELLKAIKRVAWEFKNFPYEIIGTELEGKWGLLEFHTMVDPQTKELFAQIHARVVAESIPYRTAGNYEGFPPEALATNIPAMINLINVWFPFSNHEGRNLFKPHASIGRLHPRFTTDDVDAPAERQPEFDELRPAILELLQKYKNRFNGNYKTDGMIVRQLPFNDDEARRAALGADVGGVVDNKATPYHPYHFKMKE